MRQGDFSGLVNTPSGWLPQSVVDQFKSIAPAAVTPTDSVIYQNYSLVNGSQLTLNPVPAAGTTYTPFGGNVIPKSLIDSSAVKALSYVVPAGAYYVNANGVISHAYLPRLLVQDVN